MDLRHIHHSNNTYVIVEHTNRGVWRQLIMAIFLKEKNSNIKLPCDGCCSARNERNVFISKYE